MQNNLFLIRIIVIVLFVSALLFLVFGYRNDIAWGFKKIFSETTSLNFDKNISSIAIWGPAFKEKIVVDDMDSIDKLINMLNSMEVVKRESRRSPDFPSPQPYLYVSMKENAIQLTERYVYIFDNDKPDKFCELYYVKNPKHKFQDERNEIMQYLNSLVS